jgi:hypothetical protein
VTKLGRWVPPAVAVALVAGVLGPVLVGRGFVLVYDMVFVPRQPLLPSSVGLGPALPRAVPADAVVALLTALLPGDLLQKLVLAGALLAGALGAAALVPTGRTATRVVAAVGYTWNAYVAERLFLGHWPVLLAYGMLPWIFRAGLRIRRDGHGWSRLVLVMAPAALGPTGGLLASGAALAAVGQRQAWRAGVLGLILNTPWWVPSILRGGAAVSDPAGVAAFAARGENWGGPVLSVLGLGGVWNADVVPASRSSPIAPVAAVVVTALALYGCLLLARRWGTGPARALLLLGAAGVLVAAAGSVPVLAEGLRWAVAHVPGAGLVRDGPRWAAWWALPVAVGFALAVEHLGGRLRDPLGRTAVVAGGVFLPLAVLPDLAWGGLGRLQPVHYPADWAEVAAIVRDEPRGDVLVLPFGAYRAFPWNAQRVVYDPASRLLPATTVTDDSLTVDDVVIAGEDARAAAAREALDRGAPLPDLGVGWVVVEHETPGTLPPQLDDETPLYQGEDVSLYRVEPAGQPPPGPPPAVAVAVLGVDALASLTVLAAVLFPLLPVSRVRAHTFHPER